MTSLTIVMYHYIREIKGSTYPQIKGLELDGFRSQLDYLTSNYNIIGGNDILDFAVHGRPLNKDPCLLTFDDGYKDHIKYVLPELLKRKLRGSFFPAAKPVTERVLLDVNRIHFLLACHPDPHALVIEIKQLCFAHGVSEKEFQGFENTHSRASRYDPKEVVFIKRLLQHALPKSTRNTIAAHLFRKYVSDNSQEFADELYMSADDTKRLVDSGMYVGGHGYSHLWLNQAPKDRQDAEIGLSLNFLKQIGAPTDNWIMCYPYGAYNADTLEILNGKNCAVGLTTKSGIADLSKNDLMELSRFDTNDFPQ